MNRKALILAGLAVFAFAAAAQDAVVLRRDLKEEQTDVYKMETIVKQTISIPSMGDQDVDLTSTAKVTVKTGKANEKGEIPLETVMSDISNKAEGMLAQMMEQQSANMPKEVKTSGTIDERNRIKMAAVKAGAGNPMMDMMGMGASSSAVAFLEFPEKEVKVGDTWTYELPKNPMMGKDAQVITAKLVGAKEVDGKQVWVVSTSGKFKMDVDLSEAMKSAPNNPMAGQKMMMKGTIDLTGENLIEKGTGRTVSQVQTMKSKSAIEMPEMGMNLDTSGTIKTTITLQK